MNLPRAIIRNKLFEICTTVFVKPRKKTMEVYHKKLAWWMNIYGLRFKRVGFYVIFKKVCF